MPNKRGAICNKISPYILKKIYIHSFWNRVIEEGIFPSKCPINYCWLITITSTIANIIEKVLRRKPNVLVTGNNVSLWEKHLHINSNNRRSIWWSKLKPWLGSPIIITRLHNRPSRRQKINEAMAIIVHGRMNAII